MKHALDTLRDAFPVGPTLPGEGQVHIPTGVRIKVPARKAEDNPAAKTLYERDVTEIYPLDDIERAIVQACLEPVLTISATRSDTAQSAWRVR